MERKCALHLIFMPQRCYSFCSFNGFHQLDWNSGNVVFVCVTETQRAICCQRLKTQVWFTVGHWLKSICFFLSGVMIRMTLTLFKLLPGWKEHFWCGLWAKAKKKKAQLYITTCKLPKCSIREMLTFVWGTIGFPFANVNHNDLV